MRFNFSYTVNNFSYSINLFYTSPVLKTILSNPSSLPQIVLSREHDKNFFSPSSNPLYPSDIVRFSESFYRGNTYIFDYIAKKNEVRIGSAFSNFALTRRFVKDFFLKRRPILINSKSYYNYRTKSYYLYFRSNGFRAGSFLYKDVSSYNVKLFRFFRAQVVGNLFRFKNGFVFNNQRDKFLCYLRFLSFYNSHFFNFFHVTRNPANFRFIMRSKRKFFGTHFNRKNKNVRFFLKYFYFFGYVFQHFDPKFFLNSHFFNFSNFYLSESIFFNNSLFVKKFGKKKYSFLKSF